MRFAEVLEQVTELLQRQGRVSYRALKTEFDLDDAYIQELQAELIQTQALAIDENGTALAWLPSASNTQTSTRPDPKGAPRAERRQLTVIRGDVIPAPRQSGTIAPEQRRQILNLYRDACHDVIQQFEGYWVNSNNNDLCIYFGYPPAHEDDAHRAVHAGLAITDAIRQLNTQLQADCDILLAVRLAIHTDIVVIDTHSIKDGKGLAEAHEITAMATNLRQVAQQNAVVISSGTYELIQGYFVCHDLGVQRFKNTAKSTHAYRVLSESGAQHRLDVATSTGLTPLVGRETESAQLQALWQQAQRDTSQTVLISGEAGIGKSRLLHDLKAYVTARPHTWWECRCSPHHRNSAFHPVIDVLSRLLRFTRDDTDEDKLKKLEAGLAIPSVDLGETLPYLATLLSLPLPQDHDPKQPQSPQRHRQETLKAIQTAVCAFASHHSMLLIVEDLHWIDASTLELLDLLISQGPATGLLTVLTCRPDFEPTWHDLAHYTQLELTHLSQTHIEEIVARITNGKTLPAELLRHLVVKTDGIPLFIEELTKMLLESGLLREMSERYDLTGPLPPLTIPTTLQGSLMARLDQSADVKVVAQLGATIGRTFSHDLIYDVSPFDPATLQQGLQQLVNADLLHQYGEAPQFNYVFKHALIQDIAYQSLVRTTQQDYHERIAHVLETRFTDIASAQPELLAHHFTQAGLNANAIPYWQHAAQQAAKRSAHIECIGHLTEGLALVTALPDSPERTQYELNLQLTLGNALIKLKGYGTPEVGQAYARARALCQQIDDPHQMTRVLYGLWVFYHTRAEFQTAYELAQQLLELAQQHPNPDSLLRGHNALGSTLCFLGEFDQAYNALKGGMACEAPASTRAPSFMDATVPQVANFAYASWALWYMGYPDQALSTSQMAQRLAQEKHHPFAQAIAVFYAAILHQLRREPDAAREAAEAVIQLATELEFAVWLAGGTLVRGWALVSQGHYEDGLEQIYDGLAAWGETGGADLTRPSGLAKLAEAYVISNQPELGLNVIEQALASVDATGMRFYEAELYRLRGQLQLLPGPRQHVDDAEENFTTSLQIARQQQAKSLELRAATHLSALWQERGDSQAAKQLLLPIHSWFTEGFDTADLQEATEQLENLE